MAASRQRVPWFGVASCALGAAALVAIVETTEFRFEGSFGPDQNSLNAGFNNDLGYWTWLVVAAVVAGIVIAGMGFKRDGDRRWVARTGLALNVLLALTIAVFIALAASQGAFR